MSAQPSLDELRARAARAFDLVVDASIGSPVDPPPAFVPHVLACQASERPYPPAAGTPRFVEATSRWFQRRWGIELPEGAVAPTAGSKEAIATLPWLLAPTAPQRTIVLVPAVAYPTYADGARAAGLEVVRVPLDEDGVPAFDALSPEVWRRTLLAWTNSPANPTGVVYDVDEVVTLARRHGALLASDEVYSDFVWRGEVASALSHGTDGVVVLVSISKRSNLAGLRVGALIGDPGLVATLVQRRRALGLLAAGPSQAVAAEALMDEEHVEEQRARYGARLRRLASVVGGVLGEAVPLPAAGLYLWVRAPDGDGASLARLLADRLGLVVAPGAGFGDDRFVRVSATVKDQAIEVLEERGGIR